MTKLRSECYELIAKYERSSDASDHNLQNVEVIAKYLIKITKVPKVTNYEPTKAECLSPAISARLWFDSRLRHNACKPMTRSDSTILVTGLDQVMTLTLHRLEKISDDSSSQDMWV